MRPRLILSITVWLLIAAIPIIFRHVMVPFILAFIVAYLIEPVVTRLSGLHLFAFRVPRIAAVLVVYLVTIGITAGFLTLVMPQLIVEMAGLARTAKAELTRDNIDAYADRAAAWLDTFAWVEATPTPDPTAPAAPTSPPRSGFGERILLEARDGLIESLEQNVGAMLTASQRLITGVIAFIFHFFIVLMITAFLIADFDHHADFFRGITPPQYRPLFDDLLAVLDKSLSGAIRGQALVCVVNGILTFVGLWLLGVKFAFVLAAIATVFTLVPIFGTLMSSIPIVAIALADSPSKAFAALIWIIIIHLLEANVFNPKIVGDQAEVHPVLVVFALIAGESTFGLVGALLAVPTVAIVVGLLRFARQRLEAMDTPG